MIEILTNNHYEKMMDLFDSAKQSIKIISPFITESIADKLCEAVKRSNVHCTFVTRLYMEDMLSHANSIDAIEKMTKCGIEVYALKGLHTKLYLFDGIEDAGVMGSANFTAGGFKSNIELSLCLENESQVLKDLHKYYDELLEKVKSDSAGMISDELIEQIREKYLKALSERKTKNKLTNTWIYGANIDKKFKFGTTEEMLNEISINDTDFVDGMFRQMESNVEQIKYNHTIWLKFHGVADDRMEPNNKFPMTQVMLNGKKVFLSNYPFNVNSVKEGDEIYLASLTTAANGKNEPVIMGRGILRAYNESNRIHKEWLIDYPWMERYEYYTIVDNCEMLDAPVKDGIPLDLIWGKFGSDTYVSSYGRNESFMEVSKKHHQKAHIRLSGNAKEFIDEQFEMLKKKYSVNKYVSE